MTVLSQQPARDERILLRTAEYQPRYYMYNLHALANREAIKPQGRAKSKDFKAGGANNRVA
jgi:hypothetical protein